MTSVRLKLGDSVDLMSRMGEACIDSIVCDPPYMLNFMGKEWDRVVERSPKSAGGFGRESQTNENAYAAARVRYNSEGPAMQAWHERWLREAFRVLKPGAYLVAFGGSRTYHRLACAAEDVGFEVRDMLEWFYGSGFPKSLDVSKAIDKMRDDRTDIDHVRRWLTRQVRRSGMSLKQINQHFGHADNGGGSASSWTTNATSKSLPTWDQWVVLKALLGFSDEMDAEVWRLNGRKGQPGEAWYERPAVDLEPPGMSASWTQGKGWNGKVARGGNGVTDAAREWEGWGTALKPAHEPILLARKPLQEKTVAAQVLSTGTGAMNVGDCRVRGQEPIIDKGDFPLDKYESAAVDIHNEIARTGRWPSNVLLSHSPDCVRTGTRRIKVQRKGEWTNPPETMGYHGAVNPRRTWVYGDPDGYEQVEGWECAPGCPVALLDQQSGNNRGSSFKAGYIPPGEYAYGQSSQVPSDKPFGYGDTGGASRFFPVLNWEPGEFEAAFLYQAKAAKAERNRGTEELYWRLTQTGLGVERIDRETWEQLGQEEERILHKFGKRVRLRTQGNIHSTVKPVALIRWLQRLVTPPNGVTYDPFLGSGTAAVAAVEEGFNFLGSELYPEHMDIAKARSLDALKRKGDSV